MSELIDVKDFLGTKKVLVGTGSSDVVLNSSGNVWIKIGQKTVSLSDYIKSFIPDDASSSQTEESSSLYNNYIKSSGGTMTGMLVLNGGLTTTSSSLVRNLNSNFLEGHSSSDFILNNASYNIPSTWTFSSLIVDSFSTKDGRISYSDGSLTILDDIVYDTYSITKLSTIQTGEYDDVSVSDTDTFISLKDNYPCDLSVYSIESDDSVESEVVVNLSGKDASVEDVSIFDNVIHIVNGAISYDLVDRVSCTGLTSTGDDIKSCTVLSILSNINIVVDGESYEYEYTYNGELYSIDCSFVNSISFSEKVFLDSLYSSKSIELTEVNPVSNNFNKDSYKLIYESPIVRKRYTFYEFFNSFYVSFRSNFKIGDILLAGNNNTLLVTNKIGSFTIATSNAQIDNLDTTLRLIGSIYRNSIEAIIDGSARIGIDTFFIEDDDSFEEAINTPFETDFCIDGKYYYIYIQNYLKNQNNRIAFGDYDIFDYNGDICIKRCGSDKAILLSKNDDDLKIKLHGLPDYDPKEKNMMYTDNGFLKLSTGE